MRIAIMQPYFLPYIGYFQLINAVDCFVVYDNIKYTKKGWINRNRMLLNGAATTFSLPLQKDSDALNICERSLSPAYERVKLLNQFRGAYALAPYFKDVFPLLSDIVQNDSVNLFEYLQYSIAVVARALGIKTRIITSSTIDADHRLKGQARVIDICRVMNAPTYINPIGGQSLYSADAFGTAGIKLCFLEARLLPYKQFQNAFIPWLSIIDVMMFNSVDQMHEHLNQYNLVSPNMENKYAAYS